MRHFRPAQHDDDVGRHALEHGHQLGGFLDVPDIYAKTDDARLVDEDAFDQFRGFRADHEFLQPRLRLQRTHVGQQVAQAQRSMGVAGIQGGKQDGHGGSWNRRNRYFTCRVSGALRRQMPCYHL